MGFNQSITELHTHKFDRLALQYMEAFKYREDAFLDNRQESENNPEASGQTSLLPHLGISNVDSFGHFYDKEAYSGFIPSKSYLVSVFTRLVEQDEYADNNLTALCPTDAPMAFDDNFKVSLVFSLKVRF
jgi:hypothetical protein